MNKPKIPVLITGDNQKQHIATEHKKVLIDLEVEPCFIYFFDQYNGQYVYNILLHKGKDTVIDCFNSVKSMLQTLKERQEYTPKGFANALVFAYMGTTSYDEYM